MKLAVASDFHFGFNADAAEQARAALLDGKGKADVLLAPGDLFDTRVPRQETVHEAIRIFQEAKGAGEGRISVTVVEGSVERQLDTNPVIGIYGTHERRAKGLTNVIELLHSAGVMVNCHARKVIAEKSGGKKPDRVCIQGMGGVPEEMAAQALKLMSFKPVPGCFNVFMFHQSVRELIPQDESAMTMADLPDGFDLYVNGHIHWRQEFHEAGKHLIIPGSTVVTQMKANEANPKGYYLYDTDGRKAEFVATKTRPFFYRELKFDSALPQQVLAEAREALETVLRTAPHSMPQVKLKLAGTLAGGVPQGALEASSLEREFGQKMLLSVDSQMNSMSLRDKIEFLRRMREQSKSAAEVGMDILKERLRQKGVLPSELPANCEGELFELLSQGEVDKAMALVMPE